MARARLGARGQSSAALRDLNRHLKAAGRVDLAKNMRKQIKQAGDPVVQEIRAAALAVKVQSPRDGQGTPKRSTGLRKRVAAATGISQTQKGIRIRVSETKFGPYGVTLPRYLDGSLSPRWARWRSPSFWKGPISTAPPSRIKQMRGQPYFLNTINRHKDDFRRAVDQAAQDALREMLG